MKSSGECQLVTRAETSGFTIAIRFLDALFYAIDGNFHANLKEKALDEDDFPLSKGAGFFAHEDAVEKYLEELGPLGPQVRNYLLRSLVY